MKDEILALLEEGAMQASELAAIMRADKLTVIRTLKALKVEGLTWRTDNGDTTIWSLAGPKQPPAGAEQPPKPVKGKKDLRHPHERPPSAPYKEDIAWWVGLPPEKFYEEWRKRVPSIIGSKLASKVQMRILQ